MEKSIKLSLAILLGLCLFNMPYGFYQLVRFIAMIGFGALAFQAKNSKETFIYIGLAILFQPLLKISLGRELWNIVDLIVAAGLLVTAFRK